MGTINNLIDLEKQRSELLERTLSSKSNFQKRVLYFNYFNQILSLNNANLNEAFLSEFLDDYVLVLSKFDAFGTDPIQTNLIIEQLEKLSALSITQSYQVEINAIKERIENNYAQLIDVLNGNEAEGKETDHQAYFPLIDTEITDGFYGVMESIIVRINKTDHNDKLIIIPSEKEIEKKISEQCNRSWIVASGLLKKYVKKPYKYHEIIISFDRKEGIYEGNSLGIALTLSFLEQLLKFYNPLYYINIKEQSVFTGGVTETGEILCTGEDIIKRKTETVFFSKANTFVFPKCEETFAHLKLIQLKEIYPERKIKLIPVEDINDVLNRRDLVEIKKRNLVVRTGRFIKKNLASAVIVALLTLTFTYLFAFDFDDNPAGLFDDGNTIYIKNKNGKVLWTRLVSIANSELVSDYYCSRYAKIVDANGDGKNEVILTSEIANVTDRIPNQGFIICYNYKGNKVWENKFTDKVISEREILNLEYSVNLIDTLTFHNTKVIVARANNGPSFSSAIYFLDIKNGKRLPGTFWASGHIVGAIIKDIDNDGIPEINGVGYDNGYEDLVFFSFTPDSLTKVRLTKEDYLIRNYPVAQLKSYIRFPKTDFEKHSLIRIPPYNIGSLRYEYNNFVFGTSMPHHNFVAAVGYELNNNLKDINIVIDTDLRVQRDTLVAKGILAPPYTDTEEYKNIIKNNILYLYNNKWVKKEDLNK